MVVGIFFGVCGWLWVVVDGYRWLWVVMGGCRLFWVVVSGCIL